MNRVLLMPAAAGLVSFGGLVAASAVIGRRGERACPPCGRFVGVGRDTVHVFEQGAGPPVVLVHGLAGNLRHWRVGVVERLADTFRVVAYDRPGSGYSRRARGATGGLASEAASLLTLIGRLGLARPLVVGHSFGATVALAFAAAFPDRVGALALIAPLVLPAERAPPRALRGLASWSPLGRALVARSVAVPLALSRREAAIAAAFGPEPIPPSFAIAGGGLLALRPSTIAGAAADIIGTQAEMADIPARYREIDVPVAALAGRDDRVLASATQAERLPALIDGATVEIVDGAGHMLPLTRPALVADFIRRTAARMER